MILTGPKASLVKSLMKPTSCGYTGPRDTNVSNEPGSRDCQMSLLFFYLEFSFLRGRGEGNSSAALGGDWLPNSPSCLAVIS